MLVGNIDTNLYAFFQSEFGYQDTNLLEHGAVSSDKHQRHSRDALEQKVKGAKENVLGFLVLILADMKDGAALATDGCIPIEQCQIHTVMYWYYAGTRRKFLDQSRQIARTSGYRMRAGHNNPPRHPATPLKVI